MNNDEKFAVRDSELPEFRQQLLERARHDLQQDPDVLAIYLAGSLAKWNADNYSDIDLHAIVKPEKLASFIKDKKRRAEEWGNVLFFEGTAASPVIVSHFDCFVKVDSWYHSAEEIEPSIWLKGMNILYDPNGILTPIQKASEIAVYEITAGEVAFWRTKVLAFIHETYRAAMRGEAYCALANLDSVRWLIASGWYMEKGQHFDGPYQAWSKIEGDRSRLSGNQLQLLAAWEASREPRTILEALEGISTEFTRLNKTLSKRVGLEDESEMVNKAIGLVL
ncbi:nucleotidyltransferase domain-containing protein [Planococcus sp. CAU13]|uniref:nucleotidyltransferase domain-containing protein n=1 Tax=Planococcus sp. CAU13 TaxID=1541197 RepID=UPI00052FF7E4|nr:nucleotidyltransferase domain-containing protein [Planococcus sp. CAU13]